MRINYASSKLQKTLQNEKILLKCYGARQANKITQRMSELFAANSLHDIGCNRATRLHTLSGQYKECFAIDLVHPFRLVFKPEDGDKNDFTSITIVKIIEIIDYH
ncbi:MAG: hypothetical protein HQM08_28275 [Candidatus Riflebacteria bacterium]|nr:hypothetical protein [Candidatus Riflebacteria bacterium]